MAPSGNKQMNTFKLNTLKDLLTQWILFLTSNLIYPPPKRRLVWSFCNTGENLQCVIWNRQWVNVLHMHMQARVLQVHLSMQTVHIQKQSGHRMRR